MTLTEVFTDELPVELCQVCREPAHGDCGIDPTNIREIVRHICHPLGQVLNPCPGCHEDMDEALREEYACQYCNQKEER